MAEGDEIPIESDATAVSRPEVRLDLARLGRVGIAVPSAQPSRTADEFRIVKRNLLRLAAAVPDDASGPSARCIMVTSARPAEGKTFVSINLALALASERDLNVLLIDCDTRSHGFADVLGIPAAAGLVDVLSGDLDLAEALMRTNIANLSLLPSGAAGPHVPELLSSNRMKQLVQEMARRYADRIVLFDAPPCLATSEAATLAPLMGQIVFVVEADHTQQESVESALTLLHGCPNIGLLLNKAEDTANEFGSYNYY
jgi:receptor protein-tyrosine kinase